MTVSSAGPALGRLGNWSRSLIPTSGQLSESGEKHLRLQVKQLICGSLNRMTNSHCCSRTCPGMGCRSPRRYSGWKLEFRNCAAIPGQRLLLMAERWIKGMWRRRLWWEMPVEESQASMEERPYCWVTHSWWSHHHSFFLSKHEHRELNNREASPSNVLCIELQNRTPCRVAL